MCVFFPANLMRRKSNFVLIIAVSKRRNDGNYLLYLFANNG